MIYMLIPVIVILIAWLGNYVDARFWSGANAKISFKLFRQMHMKYPEKWVLNGNYVSFYYEIPKDSPEYTELYPSKEFRGYFGPFNLLRYWYYRNEYERSLKEERAARDYADVIKAFEVLEKKVK